MKANIYHFNASCEMAVGNGTNSFTPPAFIQRFEQELELLPLYLAKPNDILLVNKHPSNKFKERLKCFLPKFPKTMTFVELTEWLKADNKINKLKPWGWSPTEHRHLSPLKTHCSTSFHQQPNANWNPEHRELYSRKTALSILENILLNTKHPEYFIDWELRPRICESFKEIEQLHQQWKQIVIKAPWSSSGRGLIILKQKDINNTYIKWIKGSISKQGFVMVEPYFNKVLDLSFHYKINANTSIEHLGNASFNTDDNGQYIGNNIQALPLGMCNTQQNFLSTHLFNEINTQLTSSIKNSSIFNNYHGVLGVDVLLYTNANGKFKINPCMEINMRQNMGTLALKIRDLLHREAKGHWQIKYFTEKDPTQATDFDEYMNKKHPLYSSEGKIISGYLPLIEPYKNRQFAVFLLAKQTD